MIVSLRGRLLHRGEGRAVVEAGGVGYEVAMAPSSLARLPEVGVEARIDVVESVAMYGGGTTLYGFVDAEEKELFLAVRDHVPNTGAKKALEVLAKASRAPSEFRRCVAARDAKGLAAGFGFTKKTAERLVAALKDRLAPPAREGAGRAPRSEPKGLPKALAALASLGYRSGEARSALEGVYEELEGRDAAVEEIIRRALKRLSS